MSRFFSPKYLAYRKALTGGPVDRDKPCPSCGYNLRGLRYGGACPECGTAIALPGYDTEPPPMKPGQRIEDDLACALCGYNVRGLHYGRDCPECGSRIRAIRPTHDLLLNTSPVERNRWRHGLAIGAACVAVATVARLAYFLAAAGGSTPVLDFGYIGITAANAAAWIAAVWLVTPPAIDRRWPLMRNPRLLARGLTLAWIPGYVCLVAQYMSAAGGPPLALVAGNLAGRFLGGVGVLCVACILSWIAEEAELPTAARRLNAAVWILWFPTLLAQAFPSAMAWFALVPLGIVLCFWAWVMTLMCLGIMELHRHVRWSMIHAIESTERADRIAETRRTMEESIAAAVRPLPRVDEIDVSLDDDRT